MSAISSSTLVVLLCVAAAWCAAPAAGVDEAAVGRPFICRGVEELGGSLIGDFGFGPHLISLFATGPNPHAESETPAQHVQWATDPRHSYLADGAGALCIWAHPDRGDGAAILALTGLTGVEILTCTDTKYAGDRDKLWDQLLTAEYDSRRPFLWGFAADDTHRTDSIDHYWYAALLPTWDEFALKRALREGAFYVSSGPRIADIGVSGSTITLQLPQDSDVFWLSAGQYLEGALPHPVEVSREAGANRCLQADRGVRAATLDTTAFGPVGGLGFVRAIVHTQGEQIAFTQPFRLGNGKIENPYHTAGTWVRGQTHNHTDSPPGRSHLDAYRRAYQEKGQLASFSTDYAYWETPHQWLPGDETPQIASVAPDRLRQGEQGVLVIRGVNFAPGTEVVLSGRKLALRPVSGQEELRAEVPPDLPVGVYDLTVITPRGFQATRAEGFTIQQREISPGWRSYGVEDGLTYPQTDAVAVVGGEIWAASVRGLSRFRDGRWLALNEEHPWYAILADPGGGAWVAGDSGLLHYAMDGSSQAITVGGETAGSSRERWGRMALDRQGQVWSVNRWWGGLAVRRRGEWHRLMPADGLPSEDPTAVTCDVHGVLWVAFRSGEHTLYRLMDDRWEAVPMPPAVADSHYVTVLASSSDGSVWAALFDSASATSSIIHFLGGKAAEPALPGGLSASRIRDIVPARDGSVWFATDSGLWVTYGGGAGWQHFSTENSALANNLVRGLAEDASGAIWCATAGGVSCYTRPPQRGPQR